MDELIQTVKSVIQDYERIDILNIDDCESILEISLQIESDKYNMWLMENSDSELQMPIVTVVDHSPHPHFLIREIDLKGEKHNYICLYESEDYIQTLFSDYEKITFTLDQLLHLIDLTPTEIEKEYQKEFLYYWNQYIDYKRTYELFLADNYDHSWLEHYSVDVHSDIDINSTLKKRLKFKEQSDVLLIPIIDIRGILPPIKGREWNLETILNVIDSKQIQHISFDCYKEISELSYSKKSIFLIFKLNDLVFGCEIVFKNKGTAKLINKIRYNCESIVLLRIKRRDFNYLNTQIGNDVNLLGKKVAIVGVGSLGSYIAREIVKAGIKHIILIDDDTFTAENLMRHQLQYYCCDTSKASMLALELSLFHPEIKAISVKEKLSADNIDDLIPDEIDIIIFAVGASDIQLSCNRHFTKNNFSKIILYAWLEMDGNNSHVLGIDYKKKGCFECLFTDENGNMVNNKANTANYEEIESHIIRNGCGGTRIAYGNSILLKTTDLVLTALKYITLADFSQNFIYSVNGKSVIESGDSFYERMCRCCNDRS